MLKKSILRGWTVLIMMLVVVVCNSSSMAGNKSRTVGVIVNDIGAPQESKKIYAALTKNLMKIDNIQVSDSNNTRYCIIVAPLITKKLNQIKNVNMAAVGYTIIDFDKRSAAANVAFTEVPLMADVASSITQHFQQVLSQK